MQLAPEELNELNVMEERLWRADFRFDRAWMETVLAKDFLEFGRSGRVYSREECLCISAQPINVILPLPDFNARLLSHDLVQLTYQSIVSSDGEVFAANRSSIWSKTTDGWKLRFHQGTPTSPDRRLAATSNESEDMLPQIGTDSHR